MSTPRNMRTKIYYSDIQGLFIKMQLQYYHGKLAHMMNEFSKRNSLLNKYDSNFQEDPTLFYKNPEEYMNFNNVELDNDIIEGWNNRQKLFKN